MAVSDQLTKLAARAKDLEDRSAAMKTKTKSDVEQAVKEAQESPPSARTSTTSVPPTT
jgi:hypothetical protein